MFTARAVASRGLGEALAPPVFGQTVNPISTRGADYAHHSNPSPPRFSDGCDGPNLYESIWSVMFSLISSTKMFSKYLVKSMAYKSSLNFDT